MDDATITKTALIVGVIGIILLYFVSSNVQVEEKKISELYLLEDSDDVLVKGTIINLNKREKVTYLELSQQSTVKVIVFDDRNLTINKGDTIEVLGKISDNGEEKEIIANKIILSR